MSSRLRDVLAAAMLFVAAPAVPATAEESDRKDCEQQEKAYVAMLACSRLLMTSDLSQQQRTALYLRRAQAALTLFDFSEAAADFTEVINVEPDNLAARSGRAESLNEHGEHALAAQDWAHIAKLRPDDIAARIRLGKSLNSAGAFDQAIPAFDAALKLDANSPEPYIGLAKAFENTGKPETADESLAAALKLNPANIAALMMQAEIAEKRGNKQLAIDSYMQALKANGMQIKPRQALQRLGIETPMPK